MGTLARFDICRHIFSRFPDFQPKFCLSWFHSSVKPLDNGRSRSIGEETRAYKVSTDPKYTLENGDPKNSEILCCCNCYNYDISDRAPLQRETPRTKLH